MTSNVSQNYPYTSESEADRARPDRRARRRHGRPRGHARGGDDAARRRRALVGLEVPHAGLPGPPPRGRLRAREARGLRRLRRDLRRRPSCAERSLRRRATAAATRGRAGGGWPSRRSGSPSRRSGFGFVYGLSARDAGFSPIEAMAMSIIVFAGAAQFAAVGYVAGGLAVARGHPADRPAQRPSPALLGGPGAVAAGRSRARGGHSWPTS